MNQNIENTEYENFLDAFFNEDQDNINEENFSYGKREESLIGLRELSMDQIRSKTKELSGRLTKLLNNHGYPPEDILVEENPFDPFISITFLHTNILNDLNQINIIRAVKENSIITSLSRENQNKIRYELYL